MKTLVIAPHPDDEILGCGGTLLRRRSEGVSLGWLIMTSVSEDFGWSKKRIHDRKNEIKQVCKELGVRKENLYQLGFPTAQLEKVLMRDQIIKVSKIIQSFQPTELLVPHHGDVHSDHRVTFNVVASCTKWFRNSSVKRVLAYETLSETEFNLDPSQAFQPNYFVDIGAYISKKIELLSIYASEMGEFPFPRSKNAVMALAQLRGCNSGFEYAEGYTLLLERDG